jgi:hypothetical protein
MAVDSMPVSLALSIRRLEPGLLSAAGQGLTLRGWEVTGDTARLSFVFRYGGRMEILAVGLVQRAGAWRVYHLGMPERQ